MELTVLGLREEREPLAQARFKRRTPRPSGTILFFFFVGGWILTYKHRNKLAASLKTGFSVSLRS